MSANGKQPEPAQPFDRFKELTRNLLAVPKKELDKKEAAYQRRKNSKKRSS